MKKIDLLEGKEYITVPTIKLYPDYIGVEEWIVVTNLKESELIDRFSTEVDPYRPWVLITVEQYSVMVEWKRNEDKYKRRFYGGDDGRKGKFVSYGCDDSFFEKLLSEDGDKDYSYSPIDSLEFDEPESLMVLKPIQRERLKKNILYGYPIREIAAEEHMTYNAVFKSVSQGKKKLRKYYHNL